ncbi:hypothetical protein B0H34DRAFT_355969 [Crassisporium funariophilum]|nr:hypothetical protein B0H34DRAFT_355969 [Crassisporium funariophilum]
MTGTASHHDAEDQWSMFVVQYACYSSLAFLTWEWLITLSFEVRAIWRKTTPRTTRLLYCAPRYLGLLALSCNSIAITRIHAIYIVDRETCQWWYGFQLLVSDSMLLSLEVLLMVRVFALFDRRRRMAMFLSGVLGLKTVVVITLGTFTVRNTTFGDACLADYMPVSVVYYGWHSIPILSLVTRDGSWTFVILLCMYTVSLVDAINDISRVPERAAQFCHVVFPVLVAMLSAAD